MKAVAQSVELRTPLRRSSALIWALGAIGLCGLVYLVNGLFFELGPGTAWGVGYGIAAAVLTVMAAVYGVRRRAMRWTSRSVFGTARSWLRVHATGGLLVVLLVGMHTGFGIPESGVTFWLWAAALWTAASGAIGLALQQWLPRTLGSALSVEVLYERIPELVGELQRQAAELAAGSSEPVRDLYQRRLAAVLAAPRRRWIYFLDITGGKRAQFKELDYLGRFLSQEEREKLERLARLLRRKLEIDAHYSLQPALRLWLWLHLPATLVLLTLLAVHVFSVLYY